MEGVKILAVVGMSGSGKSAVVEYLAGKNIPKVCFNSVVYEVMAEEGIERTAESERMYRKQIREREGKDFLAKRTIEKIKNLIDAGQKRIVLDGPQSWTEYKVLKKEFPKEVKVVATISPRKLRHERMVKRAERLLEIREMNERDWSEIEDIEKGGPIANADYYIENSGTVKELHENVKKLLNEIEFLRT